MANWIECNLPWSGYDEKFDPVDSFEERGLNNPGTLVEIRESDGKTYQFLIGDINTLRGVCDDCTAFEKEATVIRYKVLIEKDW